MRKVSKTSKSIATMFATGTVLSVVLAASPYAHATESTEGKDANNGEGWQSISTATTSSSNSGATSTTSADANNGEGWDENLGEF